MSAIFAPPLQCLSSGMESARRLRGLDRSLRFLDLSGRCLYRDVGGRFFMPHRLPSAVLVVKLDELARWYCGPSVASLTSSSRRFARDSKRSAIAPGDVAGCSLLGVWRHAPGKDLHARALELTGIWLANYSFH